jgi:hypothetical protein
MVLKHIISKEDEQTFNIQEVNIGEDEAPCDEISDLFELPNCLENDILLDNVEVIDNEEELESLPPRKRQM